MKCPYCGHGIKKKITHIPLSFKRKAVLEYIMQGGPDGVTVDDTKKKFFDGMGDITLRTTVHYINKMIIPNQVVRKGGILRLVKRD